MVARGGGAESGAHWSASSGSARPGQAGTAGASVLRHPQALVIAPTREVALQSHAAISKLAATVFRDPPLSMHVCLGGLPVADDRAVLSRGVHAVVGTPGRVRQLLQEGSLHPDGIRTFIIDEADALMGGTFEADVLFIHSMLPERKQVLAFSATYPREMQARLETMMRDPQRVMLCTQETASLRAVRQFYVQVCDHPRATSAPTHAEVMLAKEAALHRVFAAVCFHQAVVFVRRPAWGESLAKRLSAAGYPATFTAGVLSQTRRMEVMASMRAFTSRVLVSTDLTARGVDLEHVNLVVTLDVPPDGATYMHRVGRTGRFGTAGVSVAVVTAHELGVLRELLAGVAGEAAGSSGNREGHAGRGHSGGNEQGTPGADAGVGSGAVTLEPLPDVVPSDWYDYELDEAAGSNFEKLKKGEQPKAALGVIPSIGPTATARTKETKVQGYTMSKRSEAVAETRKTQEMMDTKERGSLGESLGESSDVETRADADDSVASALELTHEPVDPGVTQRLGEQWGGQQPGGTMEPGTGTGTGTGAGDGDGDGAGTIVGGIETWPRDGGGDVSWPRSGGGTLFSGGTGNGPG